MNQERRTMRAAELPEIGSPPRLVDAPVPEPGAGETLAVLGVGGIGSNAIQIGKHLGARVVAVSRSAEKLELARELGADEAVRITEAREACGGDGADVVVQCAASARLDEEAIALA